MEMQDDKQTIIADFEEFNRGTKVTGLNVAHGVLFFVFTVIGDRFQTPRNLTISFTDLRSREIQAYIKIEHFQEMRSFLPKYKNTESNE